LADSPELFTASRKGCNKPALLYNNDATGLDIKDEVKGRFGENRF
jgi:hypothetical protein